MATYGSSRSYSDLMLRLLVDPVLAASARNFTNLMGLATTVQVTETTTLVALVQGELAENATTGYVRTACFGGSVTVTYDSGDGKTKIAAVQYPQAIPSGQTWAFRSTCWIRNARTWANRVVSGINTSTDVLTLTGTMPAVGDQVIVTVDAGGTMPGGPTNDSTIYEVFNVSGQTCQLRAVGGGATVDFTSAGAGTIRLRSVDGQFVLFRSDSTMQNATSQLLYIPSFAHKGVVVVE